MYWHINFVGCAVWVVDTYTTCVITWDLVVDLSCWCDVRHSRTTWHRAEVGYIIRQVVVFTDTDIFWSSRRLEVTGMSRVHMYWYISFVDCAVWVVDTYTTCVITWNLVVDLSCWGDVRHSRTTWHRAKVSHVVGQVVALADTDIFWGRYRLEVTGMSRVNVYRYVNIIKGLVWIGDADPTCVVTWNLVVDLTCWRDVCHGRATW